MFIKGVTMQTVCLIGKTNVGKSTIFNRLIKEKKAIIMDTPNITRDRIYGTVKYKDKSFNLIDTGGITSKNTDFGKEVLVQAQIAIEESDIILFVVDGLLELDNEDLLVNDILHKTDKKVIIVVNKLDNKERQNNIYNYYELGFENVIGVSAEHNLGFNKLLDMITENMDENNEIIDDGTIKFCLIGRPNVGKSSLINALLNENRLIVSKISGTTRDAIDTKFKYNGLEYTAIDTAGLRKKGKIYENIEKFSFMRSMKAIDRSDVCVLVINAQEGIIEHDKHIASYAIDAGKALVIAVNKWDAVVKDDKTMHQLEEKIRVNFQFMDFAPIVFISAKNNERVHILVDSVLQVYLNFNRRISTSVLNDVLQDAVLLNQPPMFNGNRLKLSYATQSDICPPTFVLFVNSEKHMHFSYQRYLENQIRDNFDFVGCPIKFQLRKKE